MRPDSSCLDCFYLLQPKVEKITKKAYKPLGKGKASFTKKGKEVEYFDIDAAIGKKDTIFQVEGNAARLIIDWSDSYRSAYALYDSVEKWGEVYDYDKTKNYGEQYDKNIAQGSSGKSRKMM